MYKLFKRIEQLTGVTFSKQSKRELKINSRGFKLVVPDIVKMSAKVRRTRIFPHPRTRALLTLVSLVVSLGAGLVVCNRRST
jgi:hypothetical protein